MVKLNIDLPDSFFLEEERDGYLVSAKIKELWAVQLDLLNEFDRVCKKHNLRYILDAGSLLGAVRHKGYIPWDDDLDVSMLREDYEKLIKIAPQEFKDPYFLQCYQTEHNYSDWVTKLRRSDTTYLLARDLGCKRVNLGVFLDIFVYDSFPNDDLNLLREYVKLPINLHIQMEAMAKVPRIEDGLRMYLRYFYYNIRYGYSSVFGKYKKLDQFAKRFNEGPYKACITTGLPRYYHAKWFEETIEVPFENLMVPISASYDAMLKSLYGDYMTPVRGSSAHILLYFDPDKSYRDVVKDKRIMRELRRKHH